MEDIGLWSPSNRDQVYYDVLPFGILEFLMRQVADNFFLFSIVGYLIRLPRGFRLTQDAVKIVGSSNFPGINK